MLIYILGLARCQLLNLNRFCCEEGTLLLLNFQGTLRDISILLLFMHYGVSAVNGFSNFLLDQLRDVWSSCSYKIYFCWPTAVGGLGCSNNVNLLFSISVSALITFSLVLFQALILGSRLGAAMFQSRLTDDSSLAIMVL
ncbi:hypothetical protein DKX38_010029 [Salix brachista]|uniref:Uncharacterized protein n=1 Tax=Salix brachista TaxID=2182728 RepID=A0A5N5MCB6_9ROSI|nr:hypothetical protein DKX38_010029 [Salix brachista]